MMLFENFIDTYYQEAVKEETRMVHLGRKDRLPQSLRIKCESLEEKTKHFKKNILNIALDYGGQDEIVRAVNIVDHKKTSLTSEDIENNLDTANQPYPNPDIIIRTGGEKRLSGFMPWQSAYSELFFVDKFLPDMTTQDLDDILNEYNNRKRRFGK